MQVKRMRSCLQLSITLIITILVLSPLNFFHVYASPDATVSITPHTIGGLSAPETYVVVTESNCSLGPVPMKFNLTEKSLYFNVSGNTGETGYVNVTIPTDLMWGEFNVTLNGEQFEPIISSNDTHTFVYFNFNFTSNTPTPVIITSEFAVQTTTPPPPPSEETLLGNASRLIHKLVVKPGDTFTVNVTVSDVQGLFNWQVAIEYNTTIINCTDIWVPEDNVFQGKNPIIPEKEFYSFPSGYGFVVYGATILSGAVDVSDTGVLCSMNFTVIGTGQTELRIATEDNPACSPEAYQLPDGSWMGIVFWTFLLNRNMNPIPFIEESGSVATVGMKTRPVAIFTISPTVLEHGNMILVGNTTYFVNEPILFNASRSYDRDGNITSYIWDFGDGNITEIDNPIIYHTYTETHKTITIKLTVVDNDGLYSRSVTQTITVGLILTPLDYTPFVASLFGLIALSIVYVVAKKAYKYAKGRKSRKFEKI